MAAKPVAGGLRTPDHRPAPPGQGKAPTAAQPKPAQRMVTVVGSAQAPVSKGGPAHVRPAHLLLAIPAAKQAAGGREKQALTAKEALRAKTKAKQEAAKVKAATDAAQRQDAGDAPKDSAAQLDPAAVACGWDQAAGALRDAGEDASALIDAWLGAGNAEAIAAASEAEDVPGAVRKAARRALNVLKSRGAAIPTRPRVARLTDERTEALEATLLPPDSSGTEAISITIRDASGRYRIAEVIFRDSLGVMHAGAGWLSGSQLKEGRARALDNLGTAPVPVPVEWARYKIAAARRQNPTTGQVVPLGFDACRDLVEPAPEAEPRHPVADLEDALTSDLVAAHAAGSRGLHDEPEFRSWLPSRPALDELLQHLGQRLSAGVRDPGQTNTMMQEELEAAADRFFSPEVRGVLSQRMRDSAISLRSRRGDAAATSALAVARAIKEAGLITSPPREIPFLLAFFQKALGILAQQGGGQLRVPVPAGTTFAPAETAADESAEAESEPTEGEAAPEADAPAGDASETTSEQGGTSEG